MTAVGPGMPARDRTLWAKEELLSAIDARLKEMLEDPVMDLDFDERSALHQQRNRVAKLFRMPEK